MSTYKPKLAEKDKKQAQYLVNYYESIAPFLIDLKEEVDIGTDEDRKVYEAWTDDEKEDETIKYLTKEEYRKLPTVKRNQMAWDRFWKARPFAPGRLPPGRRTAQRHRRQRSRHQTRGQSCTGSRRRGDQGERLR